LRSGVPVEGTEIGDGEQMRLKGLHFFGDLRGEAVELRELCAGWDREKRGSGEQNGGADEVCWQRGHGARLPSTIADEVAAMAKYHRESVELGGGGEGAKGGDGFDKAGDGEGVEDAARFADEMEDATFASEGHGHANQRGDTGAVDLRDAVKVDDNLARAFLQHRGQSRRELITGIADGKAAVDV
jgi:hypothetical protein